MNIQLIIPCYNESKIIQSTYEALTAILKEDAKRHHYNYQLLFIDDGSKDDTLSKLIRIAETDDKVRYISFSRNFGKEAAMYAGIENSRDFDASIIIDSDLQHPPELIPIMIEKFTEGYDQVIAQRNRKGEHALRKIPTKLYYFLVNQFVDIPIVDGVGDFRLLSQKVVNTIADMSETQRFSKGIFSWVGYKQFIINYDNVERAGGESKWTFKKLLDYGIDGILSFNNKPLRVLLYLGFITFGVSILYILINLISILVYGIDEPGYFTLMSGVLLLGSIQLISLGIMGEYIGRIYYEVKKRPHYIEQVSNINKDEK